MNNTIIKEIRDYSKKWSTNMIVSASRLGYKPLEVYDYIEKKRYDHETWNQTLDRLEKEQ